MSSQANTKSSAGGDGSDNLFGGILEALGNKHSQLDINFQRTTVKMPGSSLGLELNGTVSLTVHLRDLTEDEKKASAARNVAIMAPTAR